MAEGELELVDEMLEAKVYVYLCEGLDGEADLLQMGATGRTACGRAMEIP